MTFKINGLDDFSNRLDQLSENAQSVAGTHEYSFKEVFSDQFMIEHTNFSCFSVGRVISDTTPRTSLRNLNGYSFRDCTEVMINSRYFHNITPFVFILLYQITIGS